MSKTILVNLLFICVNVFIKSSDDEDIKNDWGDVLLISPTLELPGRCVEEHNQSTAISTGQG